MLYYLYMLECSNGSLYTGYTTDFTRRFKEHVQGSAKCKYTRSFPPKAVAACWVVAEDLACVLRCERALKKLTVQDKRVLVKTPKAILEYLNLEDGQWLDIAPCPRLLAGV